MWRRVAAIALYACACGRISFDESVLADGSRERHDAACATCDDGLVAYWSFDEGTGDVAHDLIGGHDAMLGSDGGAYGWDAGGGARGGAAAFSFGYATVPWNLPAAVGNAFTVALWIAPTGTTLGFDRYFSMFYWNGSDHGALLMDSNNTGNGIRCAAFLGGTFVFLDTDSVYSPTGWRHAACTWDGNTLAQWANGTLADMRSVPGPFSATVSVPVAIGASVYPGGTTQNEWTGEVDDVRVYNRALTAGELAALATP